MMRQMKSSQNLIGKSGSVFLFKLAQMSENFSQDRGFYIVSCNMYTCKKQGEVETGIKISLLE